MMPVQYMTPEGVWLESCQEGTPPRDPKAILAPEGGGEGLRLDGEAWVAYAPPPDRCTRFEGLRALGRVRVGQIKEVMSRLETLVLYEVNGVGVTLSEDEAFSIRTAWEEAGSFERLSPDLAFVMWRFDWDSEMRDDFFRWIDSGNIGVFPG